MQPNRAPYNTGKVKIGLAYEPSKHRELTEDEHRLQNALLGLHDNREAQQTKRYVGVVFFAFLLFLVVRYAPR